MRENSAHDLKKGQQQVDEDAHPGAFLRGGEPLGVRRLEFVCL